jgi:TRAP transporter TAXI family solute receptor
MRTAWDITKLAVRWALLGVVVVSAIYLLIHILGIQPPKEFTIATGREGGAYFAFAEQYKMRLAEEGYTLHIRPTAGSHETLALLLAGEVDAGFVQSTAYTAYESGELAGLSTLASLYYEPLWIFYREDLSQPPTDMSELRGLRIGVGEQGSGTYTASTFLFLQNGVDVKNTTFVVGPSAEAATQLEVGELDAMAIVVGAESPLLQDLLTRPDLELLAIKRADAYTSRFKYIFTAVLYEGVIDLEKDIPAEDKQLVAARATLVANAGLHPDLARLLLIIATEIHSKGGILEQAGEFPAPVLAGIPMNPDAVRYMENGPTGLERVLPLWMASRLERIIFLLLPVALIAYPLFRGTPLALGFLNRYRLKRRYLYLRELDQKADTFSSQELDEAIARLQAFEQYISTRVNVPTSLLDDYYQLRLHTTFALERLNTLKQAMEDETQTQT